MGLRTRSNAHYLPTRPFTPPYTRHVDLSGDQHFDSRRFRESGPRFIYLREEFAPTEGVVYHPRAASHPVALALVYIQGGFAIPNLSRIFLFTKGNLKSTK